MNRKKVIRKIMEVPEHTKLDLRKLGHPLFVKVWFGRVYSPNPEYPFFWEAVLIPRLNSQSIYPKRNKICTYFKTLNGAKRNFIKKHIG